MRVRSAQSGEPRFAAPSHEACKAFKLALQQPPHSLFVKIRETKGAEKMAACGQLGNVQLRRELNRKRRAAETDETAAADAAADAAAVAGLQDLGDSDSVIGCAKDGEASERLCGRADLSW